MLSPHSFYIWETVVGERDADFNKVSTGGKDAIADQISSAHPLHDKIMSYYHRIEQSVQNHVTVAELLIGQQGQRADYYPYMGREQIHRYP